MDSQPNSRDRKAVLAAAFERERTAAKYHEFARELRGQCLNSVAVLELRLARLFTQYFCRDSTHANLFFSEIAAGLQLRNKIDLLRKIVKTEMPEIVGKYPHFFDELERVRRTRNSLAHATIDVSEKALAARKTDGVGFVTYNDGKRFVLTITKSEADKRRIRLNMLLSDLHSVGALILFDMFWDRELVEGS